MKQQGSFGLWTLTALVTGNMIGSGIFLLPADLASIGSISLFSWVLTALGAFVLALVFANMGKIAPKTGGPYAYAKLGLGNLIGFQTAYSYWIAIWAGNAAIALAATGYASVFFPVLAQPLTAAWVTIVVIWALTLVNVLGIREAGIVQLVSTILKLIPLVIVSTAGWFYFHPTFLTEGFNISGHSNFHALSHAAALTLWAFIGLESATVPAESVDNPTRNIPLATLLGTVIASVVYIASSIVIMGMLPAKVLQYSAAPFADATSFILGPWGRSFIALGAVISCIGCLNGWVLLQGQVAMAAAHDGLFPKIFGKMNKKHVPAVGLVATSVLISALLLLTVSKTLIDSFDFIITLTVLASLIPYLYTSVASIIVYKRSTLKTSHLHITIATIAAAYSCWAIMGTGEHFILYGSILLFSAVPLYAVIYQKGNHRET